MASQVDPAPVNRGSAVDGPDDEQFDAFYDILRTIRARKAVRPQSPGEQSPGPSTIRTISPRYTPSVDISFGGTDLIFGEEEEDEQPSSHTPTEAELRESRVRNIIKGRMQIYRDKKRTERMKIMEEKKAKWIERQKELGIYVEPQKSASRASGSSSASMTDEERRIKRETRRRLLRLLPLTTVVDELKKDMNSESGIRGDFLETIRLIRGVKKDDFYREPTPEPEVEEDAEEPAHEEEETEEKETPRKCITAKVNSRWPKGHQYHTVALQPDWSFLTHYSNDDLTVELSYLLPEYMRDIERLRRSRRKTYKLPPPNFKTRGIQRNLDYVNWREEMMRIAYDEEFGRGKSKLFSTVALPDIRRSVNDGDMTSRVSRVTMSDGSGGKGTFPELSPRGRKGRTIPESSYKRTPYTIQPTNKLPQQKTREHWQVAAERVTNNNDKSSQQQTLSNVYRPVGKRATAKSVHNSVYPKNKTNITKKLKIAKEGENNLDDTRSNATMRTETGKHLEDVNQDVQSTRAGKPGASRGESRDSAISTADHSPDRDSPAVTTITVHFNPDHQDHVPTTAVKANGNHFSDTDRDVRITVTSPVNREDRIVKLFDEIQRYRSKYPDTEKVKIQVRSDVSDISWILKYVNDQPNHLYTARL